MGQSLVKAYADLHHGEVNAQSTLGKGTVFTVSYPRRAVGLRPGSRHQPETQRESTLIDDSYIPIDTDAETNSQRITDAETSMPTNLWCCHRRQQRNAGIFLHTVRKV